MYGNNYYNQQRFGYPMAGTQPNQYIQPMNTPQMPVTSPITLPTNLLGKVVDSIDVVKATDIPLDGSTSYFPLTDGSAIITKRLQLDGTSKTIVYKPEIIDHADNNNVDNNNFVSLADFLDLKNDFDDLRDAFNRLRQENKDLKDTRKKENK